MGASRNNLRTTDVGRITARDKRKLIFRLDFNKEINGEK